MKILTTSTWALHDQKEETTLKYKISYIIHNLMQNLSFTSNDIDPLNLNQSEDTVMVNLVDCQEVLVEVDARDVNPGLLEKTWIS